jgi:hypothetical protein
MATSNAADPSPDSRIVSGIEPADLREEYTGRGLGDWSDARLTAAVAGIVSVPRRDPPTSFVLHAPLELTARAALLPRVVPQERELARLHVLAVASQYEASGPPLEVTQQAEPAAPREPAARLWDAIATGDEHGAVTAARTLARRPHRDILAALTDAVAPLTAAAGHAPIFLSYLDRGGAWSAPSRDLLVPLVRELARRPDWAIRWIDEPRPARETDPDLLAQRLSSSPILGPPENTFIHPLMMHVDRNGFAATQLGDAVGSFTDESARVVLRTAARSMLFESCEHAPYGWTHCLTMPQALLGLAGYSRHPDQLLALAATDVLAFRTALGTDSIPTATPDGLPTVDPDVLATAAATSHDAHIVKYALACLDAARWDPQEGTLYLAAGQRLLDCWAAAGGDPTDPLA